jgi:hypothetical protein
MLYSQLLYDEASRFLAEGGVSADEYVSLHLRRGDFVWAHAKTQSSEADVVTMLTELAKHHDVTTIFVSSDASKDELMSLRAACSPLTVLFYKSYEHKVRAAIQSIHHTRGAITGHSAKHSQYSVASSYPGTLRPWLLQQSVVCTCRSSLYR